MLQHKPIIAGLAKSMLLAAAVLAVAGCKVVSITEDRETRERRSESFDAEAHVAKIWTTRVMPGLEAAAVDAPALLAARQDKLDTFGREHGRQAGEGSPWTFAVRGEGTVSAVDTASRRGTMTIALADGTPVTLQLGPVIVDATLRDALPIFDFNDFADQMAYAAVSKELTRKALAGTAPAAANLAIGTRIRFLGVARVSEGQAPLTVLPVQLGAAN